MNSNFRRLTMFSLVVAVLATSCSEHSVARRSILERKGQITGMTERSFDVAVRKGDVLLVVLGQSGLDVSLRIKGANEKSLGAYESLTGRYGEDRAQIKVEHGGSLTLTIGARRLPRVVGSFHLNVEQLPGLDEAEANFSRASRTDQKLQAAERLQLLQAAQRGFASDGRKHEEGLAALAILNLLNDTATDSRSAIAHGERAVAALRVNGSPLLLASALNALGAAYGEAKQTNAMSTSFDEAKHIFEERGSRIGVAEERLYRAAVSFNTDDPEVLLTTFREVAHECSLINERVCESLALMDMAVSLRNRGEYKAAFEALYRSLSLVDAKVDSNTYAQVSDNLAFLLRIVGDFDGAIHHHERAIAAFASYGECTGVSRSLYGMGYSLLGIGETEQALRFYKLSIERSCVATERLEARSKAASTVLTARGLCEEAARAAALDDEDKQVMTQAVWDLGNLARSEALADVAFECHDIGARLAASDSYRLGTSLESVRDLLDLGQVSRAQDLYDALKEKLDSAHPWYRAQAADVDGLLRAASRDARGAIKQLASAAKLYRDVGNLEGVYSALSQRASLGMTSQDALADEYFVDADAALESVRLLSLDPAFSASLFASGRRVYEQWIESVLARESAARSPLESLVISERSRSRLLSQVARAFQVGKEAREEQARSVAADTADLIDRAESKEAEIARVEILEDPLPRINLALGLESLRFEEKARRELVRRLEKFQRGLGADETTVQYLLGDRRSHAWVVRRDSISRIDLAPASEIRLAVARALDALSSHTRKDSTREPLSNLFELLLRPIETSIRGSKLVIVPDGVLGEVPFAALWDGVRGEYLIERTAITYLPSLQFALLRAAKPRSAENSTALLVGDPVYDAGDASSRCTQEVRAHSMPDTSTNWRRLPASGREVEAVRSAMTSTTSVTVLKGCAANRSRVLASNLGNFRFIHFATHATADRIVPQRSAIHLSTFDELGNPQISSLTAADLLARPLRAELVVLSGCSTAGGKQFGGEGSLGFPFSLLASGSRHVITTLWPVADAASVSAMKELYDALIARDADTASALRAMQLQMLSDKRWKHPRNWAAYSLLGI